MAGIYIHIPFCHKACVYCDFHFSTSFKQKEDMVEAICKEIEGRKDFFSSDTVIETLYFGGGTPSVLSVEELSEIFTSLHDHFHISHTAEITLEANPEDLTPDFLKEIVKIGINRLSIGIQSFEDNILIWMNRNHNAKQAIACVQNAQDLGIQNISIDLIFGSPQLTQAQWEADLHQALTLNIPHLSVYALTVEYKTALAHQVNKGKVQIPEDTIYAQQFLFAHDFLESHAYKHYELSNYALAEFHSHHNSSYWKQTPYLGIGPSAHSFNGQSRMWNVANNSRYIKNISSGISTIKEQETLSATDQYHEYMMTGLRQKKGIDLDYVHQRFRINMHDQFGNLIEEWKTQGYALQKSNQYHLTPKGWLISDQLISELFLEV